jgi:hypothetical protein
MELHLGWIDAWSGLANGEREGSSLRREGGGSGFWIGEGISGDLDGWDGFVREMDGRAWEESKGNGGKKEPD